jgi:hypothetical protein
MNRQGALFQTIALTLVLLLTTGCGALQGPKGTVLGALKAMEAMDVEQTAGYFKEDLRGSVESSMESALDDIKNLKISGVSVRVVSKTKNRAVVEATYDLRVEAPEFPLLTDVRLTRDFRSGHQKEQFHLQKTGSEWRLVYEQPESEGEVIGDDGEVRIAMDASQRWVPIEESALVESPGFVAQVTGEVKRAMVFEGENESKIVYVRWYRLPGDWDEEFAITEDAFIHEDIINPIAQQWLQNHENSDSASKRWKARGINYSGSVYYRLEIRLRDLTVEPGQDSLPVIINWDDEEGTFSAAEYPILFPLKEDHVEMVMGEQRLKYPVRLPPENERGRVYISRTCLEESLARELQGLD